MRFLVLALVFVFSSLSIEAQQDIDVVLNTPSGKIYGSLMLPQFDKSSAVALIIAGSGPTDRDGNNTFMKNNSLKMLAEALARNGISSLRYDKRGVGQSRDSLTKESDLRFETYIRDAESWIRKLKGDKRFGKVLVIGHSEGSLIGMIAARNSGCDLFVSLAGSGRKAGDILKEQLKNQPKPIVDMSYPIIDKLEKGDTVGKVPPMLTVLFRPSVQPYLISWFRYDPQIEIAKLKIPVLIVQGTTDIQVSVTDAELLHKANPQSGLKLIDGMNHILKSAPADRTENLKTYNEPERPLHPELVPAIVNFIRNTHVK